MFRVVVHSELRAGQDSGADRGREDGLVEARDPVSLDDLLGVPPQSPGRRRGLQSHFELHRALRGGEER